MTTLNGKLGTVGNGQTLPPGISGNDDAAEVLDTDVLDAETSGDEAAADVGESAFVSAPAGRTAEPLFGDNVFPLKLYNKTYRRIKPLGQGGQAIALLVERRNPKGLFVARTASSVAGFEEVAREFCALRVLDHPNIIKHFEVYLGKDADGAAKIYLMTEYVNGSSLHQYIEEKMSLTEEELVMVRDEACAALSHANARKIFHRDIKPSNIMLARNKEGDLHAKVIDFGVAKVGAATTGLTSMNKGSIYYMAPEQIFGDRITAKTDMFSLGLTLLALARGKEREDDFRHEDPMAQIKELRERGIYREEFLDSIESMLQFDPARRGEPIVERTETTDAQITTSAATLGLGYKSRVSSPWTTVKELFEIERRSPNIEDILFLCDVCLCWQVPTYDLIPPETGVTDPALWANWKGNVLSRLRIRSNIFFDAYTLNTLGADMILGNVDTIANIVKAGWVKRAEVEQAIRENEEKISNSERNFKMRNIKDTLLYGAIALAGGGAVITGIVVANGLSWFATSSGICGLLFSVIFDVEYRWRQKLEKPILAKYPETLASIAELKKRLGLNVEKNKFVFKVFSSPLSTRGGQRRGRIDKKHHDHIERKTR